MRGEGNQECLFIGISTITAAFHVSSTTLAKLQVVDQGLEMTRTPLLLREWGVEKIKQNQIK